MQIKCKTCGTNLIFVNSIGCSRCPKCSAENHKTALAPDTVEVPVELVKRIIDRSERTMDFLTDEANTEYLQHCCGHF
jgi:ribosomal protein L37AE/L43A